MFYRNNSFVAKTFYGVTFQPGEVKEVPGYINHKSFCIVDAPKQKEPPTKAEMPTKSEQPTTVSVEDVNPVVEEVPKKEEVVEEQPKETKRKYQRKEKVTAEPTTDTDTKVGEVETKSEKEENV